MAFSMALALTTTHAQSVQLIDSLSNVMYLEERWQDLSTLLNQVDLKKIKSASLYYKASVAAIETQNYCKSEQWARLALNENKVDENTRHLLAASLSFQGKMVQSIFIGQQSFGYQKHSPLSDLGINAGIKYSTYAEPSSLSHLGLMFQSRVGFRFHWQNFVSYNAQNYFWEDMQQWNWSSIPSFSINSLWRISIPIQIAKYQAKVDFRSNYSNPPYSSLGNISQNAYHLGIQAQFSKNYLDFSVGLSWLQSNLLNDYEVRYNLNGSNFNNRINSQTIDHQKQINTHVALTLPIVHERIKIGLQTHWIATEISTYVFPIPEVSYRLSNKLSFYANYWNKKRFMVQQMQSGILINNANTQTQRMLLNISYWHKKIARFDLSYLHEWGRDELYNQPLQFNGLFLSFTYFLKP